MNIRLNACFPQGYTPNSSQVKILEEIGNALEAGHKFILINAPTATGKSFIAKTIANYSNNISKEFRDSCFDYSIFDQYKQVSKSLLKPMGCAVLTVSKNLQDQYISTFSDGAVLKGKNSYVCPIVDMLTCDEGVCRFKVGQKATCQRNGQCPYYNARNLALTNKCAFYNYSMFDCLDDRVKHKKFLVCDEVSELENELVKMYSLSISYKDIAKISKHELLIPSFQTATNEDWRLWANEMLNLVSDEYESILKKLGKKMKTKKLSKDDVRKMNFYKNHKDTFTSILDSWNLTNYIISSSNHNIIFQPYNLDRLAQEKLFSYGEVVILMSATIINHRSFAETFGIKDYAYIEVESPLDSSKAPIYFDNQFYMNYNNSQEGIARLYPTIKAICEKFKNKKGIIHTHSMKILQILKGYFENDPRFLWREGNNTNDVILEAHMNTDEPTILVSPSMTHGIDLKGDLGEFQIILKAPYLPFSDARIKKKADENPQWYLERMISTLVQESGRCNRCDTDYSETFILDACCLSATSKSFGILPEYFRKRCKKLDNI